MHDGFAADGFGLGMADAGGFGGGGGGVHGSFSARVVMGRVSCAEAKV